jgi:hypothetical protein
MKVTVLDRKNGVWSQVERSALTYKCQVEIESLGRMPGRLVIMNRPTRHSFKEALGHADFTEKQVEYGDQWK